MTTATKSLKPIKVTRVKDWPNGLGFDCTVNRVRFSVMSDRRIGRLLAVRLDADGIHDSCRIVDGPSADWVKGSRATAELVYRMWRDARELWTKQD